jgi:hypothetical protein
MSILYRGPAIDASYPVSVRLANGFKGKKYLGFDQSATRIPSAAIFANGSRRT